MLFEKFKLFRSFIVFILIISSIPNLASASDNEQSSNFDYSLYYYNQLNSFEKTIYDNLIKSQEKFLNKEEVIFSIATYDTKSNANLQEYIYRVMKSRVAYIYDNPEVDIWFDSYKCSLYAEEGIIYLKCSLKTENNKEIFFSSTNLKESISEFEEKCFEIANNLSGSEEEKLKQLHDYLTKNAVYDKTLSLPNTRTAYGNIMEGHSVCSGFAFAYKYIANLAGLKVLYVVGNLYDKQKNEYILHAWNVAYVDGKHFLIDTTLDIPINSKSTSKFFLAPLQDGMHYVENNYFDYTF